MVWKQIHESLASWLFSTQVFLVLPFHVLMNVYVNVYIYICVRARSRASVCVCVCVASDIVYH